MKRLSKPLNTATIAFALTLGLYPVTPSFADDLAKGSAAESSDSKSSGAKSSEGGEAVYASSFKNLNDKLESLAAFKGKVTVVYFWATWCVPCRVETPKLVKLYKDYKAKGVEVVGIALDNADKVRAFAKEMNANYPIFYGGHDAVELGKTLGNDQGAIPFMVVIDKSGKVVETFKGDLPDGKLEAVIDPLIG